jgi:CDP-diacylglycerol--glycerol-3-phosphate 3-phosphatidyltransferase
MWLAKVPNALTAFRVAAVPVLALLFYAPPYLRIWCPWIFIFASITDLLDGWIARRYKLCSAFGAFLDPVADKLMVAMAMVLLSERLGALVAVCSGVTLCREIGVSALREWMAELGKRATVKVGFAGKCKTTLQMVALGALLIYASGDCPSGAEASVLLLGEVTLVLSTILATTSGVGYLQAAWPSLMEQDS